MAAYTSVFLVGYVLGFPVMITATLWCALIRRATSPSFGQLWSTRSYRRQLRAQAQGPGQVCKLVPEGLLLGFLLDDYKLKLPCYLW